MLPVLMYHFVGTYPRLKSHRSIHCHAPVFARQMRLLRRLGWSTIPLLDAAQLRADGRQFPPKRFVLTFDDGDADILWSVAPVLDVHAFTATMFIVTDHIGGETTWERDEDMRHRRLLSAKDIRTLAASGWDIGAHTKTHPKLAEVEPDRARDEIVGSRDALESLLGSPPRSFCYPSGSVNDAVAQMVRDAGFRAAVTTERRLLEANDDPFRMPRIGISHRAGPLGLLWRIRGTRG